MDIKHAFPWLISASWIIQVFIIIFCSLIVHFLELKFYKKLFPRLQHSRTVWDDSLCYALHKPLGALIWVLGIGFAATITGQHAHQQIIFAAIAPIRNLAIIILIVWFLLRFISYSEERVIAKRKRKGEAIDKTTLHALCQLLRASVIITAVLVALQIFGIPISGVLAFGGIGGIAVGFAAKDLLANFFGGLMIVLDRPFLVGDWIRSPDKNIEGTVEHIGWRLTRIRTFDKRPLFVPNGTFSTISVENPSRMTNRRINAVINLRYDDANKVDRVLADIEKMLKKHPDIDAEQTLMVNLIACSSWSLDFMIYTFTKTTNWQEFQKVQQNVLLKVLEIVAKHGAECAFPTSTVHIPEGIAMHSNNKQ